MVLLHPDGVCLERGSPALLYTECKRQEHGDRGGRDLEDLQVCCERPLDSSLEEHSSQRHKTTKYSRDEGPFG